MLCAVTRCLVYTAQEREEVLHFYHGIVRGRQVDDGSFVQYFGGNSIMEGSQPAAHCYCGHQFGYFSGQLGDGAAIYLGEVGGTSC